MVEANSLADWASRQRAEWDGNPHAIHARAPFAAHSFDCDDRFWVVGSTSISVLHGWHGDESRASNLAAALNGVDAG